MKKLFFLFVIAYSLLVAENCSDDTKNSDALFREATMDNNFTKLKNFLRDSCDKNCAKSCNSLGVMYNLNLNGNIYYDQLKSYHIFYKSCLNGYSTSCINAARLPYLPSDKKYLLGKALSYGNKLAYYYLGDFYQTGGNYSDSIKMYKLACESKVTKGCIALAHMYHDGLYVTRNMHLADFYSQMSGYKKYSDLRNIIE